jgi:hypothetical protein
MNSTTSSSHERTLALRFPLFVFAVSRLLLFVFAKSGPLFGPHLGVDAALAPTFQAKYPTLAALAHGEIASLARIANGGYSALADVAHFPLLPWLGRGLGVALGSVELGLLATSVLLCALGFVGVFQVLSHLRGTQAARWGLALLAAFPLSYHLSDGGALAALFAFPAWAIWLAMRGRPIAAASVLSAGALAHPLCALAAPALAWPPSTPSSGAWLSGMDRGGDAPVAAWARIASALAPIATVVVLLGVLGTRFHSLVGAFQNAFLHTTPLPLPAHWLALLSAFGALEVIGLLMLARTKSLRVLALVGGLQLLFALGPREPASAYAMAACWPAFIAWGDLLGRRPSLRGPAIAVLATHQGLLLYCFTHFVRFS